MHPVSTYKIRKKDLMISFGKNRDGVSIYLRSDHQRHGRWSSIAIHASYMTTLAAVAGSITKGRGHPIRLPADGELGEAVRAFDSSVKVKRKEKQVHRENPLGRDDVPAPPPETDRGTTGTGFAVTANGMILTNNHVVRNCRDITVDGTPAKLVGSDKDFDLALLKVAGGDATAFVRFAALPAPLNADVTVAGYPLAGLLGGLNVTRGAVTSAKGMLDDTKKMQISAPIQPGNSGGPVVNARGELIGVVVAKLDAKLVSKYIGDIPQNVNFAVRGEIAKLFLMQNGVAPAISNASSAIPPELIATRLQAVTHFIECN
ncbi:serine protease [Breoghania sp.]|uniref:S1C family serine protease n=1 Tax=Breoghania sp. TaxID=2065378 RepID=UPI002AAA8415|nr:serine protease [Breoghania sp.]